MLLRTSESRAHNPHHVAALSDEWRAPVVRRSGAGSFGQPTGFGSSNSTLKP